MTVLPNHEHLKKTVLRGQQNVSVDSLQQKGERKERITTLVLGVFLYEL